MCMSSDALPKIPEQLRLWGGNHSAGEGHTPGVELDVIAKVLDAQYTHPLGATHLHQVKPKSYMEGSEHVLKS